MQNGYRLTISALDNSVSIFRIRNGVSELLQREVVQTNLSQSYFYRILHDKERGELRVYRHNQLIISTLDVNPLATRSQQFALMTTNAQVSFDNLRAYPSRGGRVHVLVGSGAQNDISAQAQNGVPKAKIKSIVLDESDRFSSVVEKTVLVDYSCPPSLNSLRINNNWITSNSLISTQVQAQTPQFGVTSNVHITLPATSDANSGIIDYYIMIKPMDRQLVRERWFSVGTRTSFDTTLTDTRSVNYRVYVKTKNGAGLFSTPFASPTFAVVNSEIRKLIALRQITQSFDNEEVTVFSRPQFPAEYDEVSVFPNPAQDCVELPFDVAENVPLSIYNMYGQKVKNGQINGRRIDVTNLKSGIYIGYLQTDGRPKRFKILKL